MVGYGWIWLDMVGYGWIWLDMVGYGWIWLDMVGYGGYGGYGKGHTTCWYVVLEFGLELHYNHYKKIHPL
jgi:hypothetical protein